MTLTKDDLKSIMPDATASALDRFCDPINSTLAKYQINTPLRIAAFIAQIAHESGQLNLIHELWGPTNQQRLYERDFSQPWKPFLKKSDRNYLAFELGNAKLGDGKKFRGHGLIQVTGYNNHLLESKRTGIDFVANPELLEGAVYASDSAGGFWATHNINAFADAGDFDGVCDCVNRGSKTKTIGDTYGFKERLEFYERAKKVIHA